jgi:hypothetical protein
VVLDALLLLLDEDLLDELSVVEQLAMARTVVA